MRRFLKTGSVFVLTALFICTWNYLVYAWGPSDRPTFTDEDPPDYVTFNSITNNQKWGDERGFAFIREDGIGEWSYRADLEPGKIYEVMAFYHNNATSDSAVDAYAQVEFPSEIKGETKGTVAFGAKNANPQKVWSTITFYSKKSVELTYVADSAELHNFERPVSGSPERTFSLPSKLFGGDVSVQNSDGVVTVINGGTPIGFDELDGSLPGGNFYSGYITFKVGVPGKSDVAGAIDDAVTVALFAAFLAAFLVLFMGCLGEERLARGFNEKKLKWGAISFAAVIGFSALSLTIALLIQFCLFPLIISCLAS